MNPHPIHRLPAPLEAATQRLRLAVREGAERTIESLGLAALSCGSAYERDALLTAQFELNRKSAVFTLAFNEAFDERVLREVGAEAATPPAAARGQATAASGMPWPELKLVDDREVEAQITAERFGMEISHACEWEMRELNGYVASLLSSAIGRLPQPGEREANPLRPEIVGHALVTALEKVSDRTDTRQLLARELQRSLTALLRTAYAEIVGDLRRAGVQPMGLSVRVPRSGGPDTQGGHSTSGYGSSVHGSAGLEAGASGHAAMRSGLGGFGPSAGYGAGQGVPTLGVVDPALMSLIRRLAYVELEGGAPGGAGSEWGATPAGAPAGLLGAGQAGAAPLPNLIRAHRDELRRASTGKLDHMVIDVIGSLFDQILSDPKVPPQMARQIARLQLPVLRAALGDPAFFTSRRHPVRRFINRIASLGAAFEDMSEDASQRLLGRVRALVQEVVEGDFDQIQLYESKLGALEAFVAGLSREALQAQGGAADVLAAKEDQLRLRQVYAQRLEGELSAIGGPEFLRRFVGQVWSQALLRAVELEGEGGARVQRWRRVARDLFVSVQPKPTPTERKAFLAELPLLMQELTEGLNLIGWPQDQRNVFFGQLMPAHAEALKAPPGRALDINLMARQVEGALQRPLPSREELRRAPVPELPVLTDAIELPAGVPAFTPAFSAEEAQRVGLVDEAAVDWDGRVDIDLGEAQLQEEAAAGRDAAVPLLPGLPAAPAEADPADATEALGGAALVDALQLGSAYRMHLQGQWQKVRLAHVSDGRSFFAFTHGQRHKQTVSMTRRMVTRMCETGRLKPFEEAYLLERATARARKQLAALGAAAR